MVKCGAELEAVKAANGLSVLYTFNGTEDLRPMQYCVAGTHVRSDISKIYRVPAGTKGWIQPNGTLVVLEGCVNLTTCLTCKPAPAPVLPAKVRVVKKTYDTESALIPTPTGAFTIMIGDYPVELDANGEGEIEVPTGTYEVKEYFDETAWEQIYLSASTVTVEPGKTVTVEIKNQQKRPAPAPMPVKAPPQRPVVVEEPPCPKCVAVASSLPVDSIGPKTPPIKVAPKIEGGAVTEGAWYLVDKRGRSNLVAPVTQFTLSYGLLKHAAKGLKGKQFFLRFTDGKGIDCGVDVYLVKKGRRWFWYIPGLNCVWQAAHPGKWKGWDGVEKSACLAVAGYLTWYFWPVEATKHWPLPKPDAPFPVGQ